MEACRIARVDEFADQLRAGLRHDRRRARRQALRRTAAARLHRARHPGRSAHPDPRRGHLSLDSESEALIQEGLVLPDEGRTTFVIAHRLSTIRRADQILVVEAGRIVERGTHEALYDAQAATADLYTQAARPRVEPVPRARRRRPGSRRDS